VRPSPSRTRWARRLYPDPEPLESVEEWARAHHADLAQMGPAELYRELGLAQMRALADDKSSVWLVERIQELKKAFQGSRR